MFVRVAILSALTAATGFAPAARAGVREELQKQLAPTAEAIVKVMQDDKPSLKTVAFGQFSTPQGPESAYAVGVREELIAQVVQVAKQKKYPLQVVDKEADLEVLATMRYARELVDAGGQKQQAVIQVRFTLDKSSGGQIVLPKDIEQVVVGDPAVVAGATGSTIVFKSGSTAQADRQDLGKQKEKLQGTFQLVDGKMVRAQPGSPYGVEVLVVDESRAPKSAKGWESVKAARLGKTPDGKNPFVELQPGQAYAIRITNDSKYDAAVEISIDGLSVFHFVDGKLRDTAGQPVYQYYIVSRAQAGGYGIIPGWHKDNSKSLSFVVQEFGKGQRDASVPAPKKGAPGVITVSIAGAWNSNENPPADIRGKNAGKNETGTGAPVETGFTEVEREIGKFNTVISIHYSH